MNMLTVNYPEKNIGPSAGTKWQSKSIFCLILVILNDQNKLLKSEQFLKPEVLKEHVVWNLPCSPVDWKLEATGGKLIILEDSLSSIPPKLF